MNSQIYQRVLRSHLLPNAGFLAEENWKFQQNNALVHASNNTKYSFLVNIVEILKFQAKYPDFNPTENLLGDLARRYANGHQLRHQYARNLLSKINDIKQFPDFVKTNFIHERKNIWSSPKK